MTSSKQIELSRATVHAMIHAIISLEATVPARRRDEEGRGFRGDNVVYKRSGKGTLRDADGNALVDYVGRRGYDWYYSEKEGRIVKTAMLTGRNDTELDAKLRQWKNLRRKAEQNFAIKQIEVRHQREAIKSKVDSAKKLKQDYARVNDEIENLEVELREHQQVYDQNTTLTMLCLFFIARGKAVDTTKRIYESYLYNHIAVPYKVGVRAIGDIPFDQLSPDDFAEWETALCEPRMAYEAVNLKSLSSGQWEEWFSNPASRKLIQLERQGTAATAHKAGSFLIGVLNWATSDRKSPLRFKPNPLANYKREIIKPRKAKTRRASVRGNEFDLMVKAANELNLKFMIPLMALVRCGFRPSEARALRWIDRLDEQRFRVAGRIVFETGKGQIWKPGTKTTSATDEVETVTLSKSTIELLEKFRQSEEYVVSPVPYAKYPWLGTQYTDYWHQIAEHAGIEFQEGQTTYALKHGLISELLLESVAPHTIVLMTRHTTLDMVMRVYNDIGSSNLADKVDEMDSKRRAQNHPSN